MNFKSHIIMGRLLYDYLHTKISIPFNRFEFVYGNVRPDIIPGFFATLHTKDNFLEYVKKELFEIGSINLMESVNDEKSYSLRLGVICHYITDFFCFPHTNDFHDGVLAHHSYEKRFYRYLKERTDILEKIDVLRYRDCFETRQEMEAEIERFHERFLETRTYYGFDLLYAYEMCITVSMYLLSQIEKRTSAAMEVIFDEDCLLYGHLLP